MDLEKLEQWNSLKEKGVITKEEFEEQKKIILEGTQDTEKVTDKSATIKKIIQVIVGIAFLVVALVLGMSPNIKFACDETSMKEAQDLANQVFPNWNGALRLSNPILVSQSENNIICSTDTNIKDLPKLTYELTKQENGEIFISTNPVGEIWENEMNKAEEEWEQEMNELFSD